MHIANLGDAEIVLGQKTGSGVAPVCVSQKHKPNSTEERTRVEAAGGHIIFGRILGSLAVSRSFGDAEFKFPQNKGTDDFVTADPYTATVCFCFCFDRSDFFFFPTQVSLTPDNQFMIVACDGLWDKVIFFFPQTEKNSSFFHF